MARPRGTSRAAIERYCLARPGATATRPFGPEPLVFKAGGKMFALLGEHDDQPVVSLKCDPDRALVLRTSYAAITPGYHLNKEHWNTVVLDGTVPAALVRELIDHAHELVTRKPARKAKVKPRGQRAKRATNRVGRSKS